MFLTVLALFVLGRAVMAVVDTLGRAGRALVRVVLALCAAGFAVAAGALASLAVDHFLGEATVLGLSGGLWAGIATTCLLLTLAAYRNSIDEALPATMPFTSQRHLAEPALAVPRTARPTGPWWSPTARRAKRSNREELARAEAWDQFARHADWAAARIAVARAACEGFLRSLPAEPGLMESELAVALRRRVPEIIAEAVEPCSGATPSEARALAEEGVELLELLAAEAERRRPVIAGGAGSRLATKRAYVENVVKRGRLG